VEAWSYVKIEVGIDECLSPEPMLGTSLGRRFHSIRRWTDSTAPPVSFLPRCAHRFLVRPVDGLGEGPASAPRGLGEREVERRGGHDGWRRLRTAPRWPVRGCPGRMCMG
jgi:hypothetical protein